MCVCVVLVVQVNERQKQLIRQLRSLLAGPQATPERTTEVLEYFFDKLTGSSLTPRRLALKVSPYRSNLISNSNLIFKFDIQIRNLLAESPVHSE